MNEKEGYVRGHDGIGQRAGRASDMWCLCVCASGACVFVCVFGGVRAVSSACVCVHAYVCPACVCV